MACHVVKSDIGHTRLRVTIEKKCTNNFCQPVQNRCKEKEVNYEFFYIHLAPQSQLCATDNEAAFLTRS